MRRLLTAAAVLVALGLPGAAAVAAADAGRPVVHRGHAIAMFGEPKYPPGFAHFAYVNPQAPKGGEIRLGVAGSFDSFNPYIVKGNPGPGSSVESLTEASLDEPFTRYGLIAEEIAWPEDRSWVEFTLRPEARWHDGQPITVDDVLFSFETLKTKGRPFYRFYYAPVAAVEAVGPRTVRFSFREAGNRELPLIAGEMPVLPKHYWEGRDFARSTLEPPLGSGPYRVASFEAGRSVTLERVPDYWGARLPVNVGQDNFDRMRFEFFRDETVLREALKGGALDYRVESQAKAWALDYDVPAVRDGWLIKRAFPHQRPAGMQAFVYNTRRAPFDDARVREALAYAFDFEWTNRTLFFEQYTRAQSYFNNSEMAAKSPPDARELAELEPLRDRLPERVFTEVYRAPATDGSGWPRANLEKAFALLARAGWSVRDFKLVNDATGRPMTFEILLDASAPGFERIVLPFLHNLKRLGVEASIREVDETQYINRVRDFDFDMIVGGWGQSESPGNEQRNFWTSAAADQPGSQNYAGVRDEAVDALVEALIRSPDRETLVARSRALDRALLWGFYVIPQWYSGVDRVLYWDKFSYPPVIPDRGVLFNTWWWDEAKAARLAARKGAAVAAETR